MQRITPRLANLFLVVAVVAVALIVADDVRAAKDEGKELYKEHCKSCHGKGAAAGEYTPMTLIQEQWERFFDKRFEPAHKDVSDPAHENKLVPEAIGPERLKTIRKFCVDHAADSEHPMTCG